MEKLNLLKTNGMEIEEFIAKKESICFEKNFAESYNNKLSIDEGVAYRVVKGDKVGFANTNNIDDKVRVQEKAKELAKDGIPLNVRFPEDVSCESINEHMHFETSDVVKIQHCFEELCNYFKKFNCKVKLDKISNFRSVMNTRNTMCKSHDAYFKLTFESMRNEFGNGLSVFKLKYFRTRNELYNFAQKMNWELDRIKKLKTYYEIESKLPVIFAPQALAGLVLSIVENFNAKEVMSGTSILERKKFEFDEKFELYDAPKIKNSVFNVMFDDEGTRTYRKPLIKNSKCITYFSDLITEAKYNYKSTGNGFRRNSYTTMPTPNFINIDINNGDTKLDNYLNINNTTILIKQIMGLDINSLKGGFITGRVTESIIYKGSEAIGTLPPFSLKIELNKFFTDIGITEEVENIWGFMNIPYLYKDIMKIHI
ncbi:metallopeptidase TldD-related protein [Paramaledivibacter caminithermalis]|jgi:predicted Zn-dependent protease|nr:metallopeptidase TldD-related protein [Paramaledivibacter caminithermalis]